MRRSRRGGHSGREFGGSGEDSFVAVVVTKLTGALLFILLLTMVIMALLPKAMDGQKQPGDADKTAPLAIRTPDSLPEAIVGRPYVLALAASGGQGELTWSVAGQLPEGLTLDPVAGLIQGTPKKGTSEPIALQLRVSDGQKSAASTARMVVYQSEGPLTMPGKYDLKLPSLPWRTWFEQGFGFLVLFLVYLYGQNVLRDLKRWALARADDEDTRKFVARRHAIYRNLVRLVGASAMAVLAGWLWMNRSV